ncbi:hypothetical protein DSM104329_01083 [Capillimicrobium parvum]|uniref:Uncharacterized protein n=2 Tax=Capillimicrobium parvum TaxID=2884022 RepID=A0A9E6XVT7_9ACTN|nr:hypothetical protein DSM104329_01083 [Capillimicrobium parvum]
MVCHVAVAYATTGLFTASGELEPAPFADLPGGPWPDGPTALKRLGTDLATVRRSYRLLVHQSGPLATLSEELVAEIVPRRLWPVISRMAQDGPEVFARRADRSLETYALTTVAGNKRRTAGPPSIESVRTRAYAFRRLAGIFVELNQTTDTYPELADWTRRSGIAVPKPPAVVRREVRAPRLEVVRTTWADLDRRVRKFLRIDAGDDLFDAVNAMPDYRLVAGGLYFDLRRLVALELFVLLGGRLDAIRRLNKSDLVLDTIGPAPDHRHGAVLLLRPGKTLDENVIRRKPLPQQTTRLLQAWLLYLRRHRSAVYYADARRVNPRPESPDLPADHPLLVARQQTLSRWDTSALRVMFSGQPSKRGRKGGTKALIPRDGGWAPDLPVELRAYVGYTPHEFRRLALQLAERAGAMWDREHPSGAAQTRLEPGMYGSALLDHAPPGNPLRNLYADRHQEDLYELLSGRAIEGIRRLLTGPEGARRRPDRKRLEALAQRLRLVDAEIARLHERAERLAARAAPGSAHMLSAGRDSDDEDPSDRQLLEALVAGQRDGAAQMFEQMDRLRIEQAESGRLLYEQSALYEIRQRVREELDALWHNETRWEIVPDDAPPGAETIDFTLDDILAGADLAPAPSLVAPTLTPIRDWLLVVELAEVAQIDRTTVARYLHGQALPPRRDARPWEPSAIPMDRSLGRSYRRIWIPGVNTEFWRTEAMKLRLAVALSSWPAGPGWTRNGQPTRRCTAPLHLPPGFASGAQPTGHSDVATLLPANGR